MTTTKTAYTFDLIDDGTVDTVIRVTDNRTGQSTEVRYDCEYAADYRDESGALDLDSFLSDHSDEIIDELPPSEDGKVTVAEIRDGNPWEVVKRFGDHMRYTGDMNPFNHGGMFYSVRNWQDYDYACCVSLWVDPDTDQTVVETGIIHKDDSKLAEALEAHGLEMSQGIECEIECFRDVTYEPDSIPVMGPNGYESPSIERFDESNENDCWAHVLDLLNAID